MKLLLKIANVLFIDYSLHMGLFECFSKVQTICGLDVFIIDQYKRNLHCATSIGATRGLFHVTFALSLFIRM